MTNTKRLFRALSTGIRGWVYGSVVDNGKDRCFIIEEHLNHRIPVIYDTIGQYVSCLDAYEGDILFGSERDANGVIIATWHGTVTYSESHSRLIVVDDSENVYEVDDFQFDHILGTVHDESHFIREQIITFQLVRDMLHNSDAVISHETAATLLELSIPTFQSTISVYSEAELNIPGVYCHIVEDLNTIPHQTISGLKISDTNKTLEDLILEFTNSEILYSSLSNYKTRNPEGFKFFIQSLSSEQLDAFISIEENILGYSEAE